MDALCGMHRNHASPKSPKPSTLKPNLLRRAAGGTDWCLARASAVSMRIASHGLRHGCGMSVLLVVAWGLGYSWYRASDLGFGATNYGLGYRRLNPCFLLGGLRYRVQLLLFEGGVRV